MLAAGGGLAACLGMVDYCLGRCFDARAEWEGALSELWLWPEYLVDVPPRCLLSYSAWVHRFVIAPARATQTWHWELAVALGLTCKQALRKVLGYEAVAEASLLPSSSSSSSSSSS